MATLQKVRGIIARLSETKVFDRVTNKVFRFLFRSVQLLFSCLLGYDHSILGCYILKLIFNLGAWCPWAPIVMLHTLC